MVSPQACGAGEPSEREDGDTDHREQEAIGLLFHETHGAAASGADVVGYRSVGLRFVHGKLVALPGSKVARRGSGRDVLRRIVNNEGVGLGKKRDSAGRLVLAGIPDDGLRLLEGLVCCNSVESIVGRAGSEYVDVLRVAGQHCVVPDKGDVIVDLVVAGGRHGIRGDHGSAACRHARVEHACRIRL